MWKQNVGRLALPWQPSGPLRLRRISASGNSNGSIFSYGLQRSWQYNPSKRSVPIRGGHPDKPLTEEGDLRRHWVFRIREMSEEEIERAVRDWPAKGDDVETVLYHTNFSIEKIIRYLEDHGKTIDGNERCDASLLPLRLGV